MIFAEQSFLIFAVYIENNSDIFLIFVTTVRNIFIYQFNRATKVQVCIIYKMVYFGIFYCP